MCDGIGRVATVPNTSGPVFINHNGNVGYGSGSGAAPDNTGVWTQLYPCPWFGPHRISLVARLTLKIFGEVYMGESYSNL